MKPTSTILEKISANPGLSVGELLAASQEAAALLTPVLQQRLNQWLVPILNRLDHHDALQVLDEMAGCGWGPEQLRTALQRILKSDACSPTDDDVVKLIRELESDGSFRDPLGLERAIASDAKLIPWVQAAALFPLGAMTGLPLQRLQDFATHGLRADHISDATLTDAINRKWMSRDEGLKLGLASSLVAWVGPEAAAKLACAQPTGQAMRSVRELASVSPQAWTDIAKAAGLADRAGQLRGHLEVMFPGEVLLSSLDAPTVEVVKDDLKHAAKVLRGCPGILNSTVLHEDASIKRLQRLVRQFPKLQLEAVLAADDDEEIRAARVVKRVAAVATMVTQGDSRGIFDLDLGPGSADVSERAAGIDDDDVPFVLAALAQYRGLHALSNDLDTTTKLLGAGLSSAFQIATTSKKTLRKRVDLSADTARQLAQAANHQLAHLATPIGVVLQLAGPGGLLGVPGADNTPDDAIDYLRERPELRDLLGKLNYCRCQACESLLSPAAYFVDLMQYVNDDVLEVDYLDDSDPYHLRNRRPDLWTMRLDCDAIHGTVATLDIAVDVLERYVEGKGETASAFGLCSGADAEELREARQRPVYAEHIASAGSPTGSEAVSPLQPSLISLAEVDALLTAHDARRVDIAEALVPASDAWLAAALHTSQTELPLLRTAAIDVTRIFGTEAVGFAAGLDEDRPDVSVIAKALRIDRDELEQLIGTRFVSDDDSVSFKTVRSEGALQADREVVTGLTVDVLDRLHRMVRIWKHLDLDAASIDLWLGAMFDQKDERGTPVSWTDLLEEGVKRLAGLYRWHQTREISVEDLAILTGPLATWSAPGSTSPFAQRFAGLSGSFLHSQAIGSADAADMVTTAQVAAGCGTTPDILWLLIKDLRPHLAPVSDDASVPFELTPSNLSLLTRHARAAHAVGHGIDGLFGTLRLRGKTHLSGIDDFAELLETNEVVESLEVSLLTLQWILTGGPAPRDVSVDAVITRSLKQQPLLFAASVLGLVPGVTPELSERVVVGSAAFTLDDRSNRYRLADGFDPATALPLPPGLSRRDQSIVNDRSAEITAVLSAHWLANVAPTLIAGPLDRGERELTLLMRLAEVGFDDAALIGELLGQTEPVGLRNRVESLTRLSALFHRLGEQELELVNDHRNLISWGAGGTVDWQSVVELQRLTAFLHDVAGVAQVARQSVAGAIAGGLALGTVDDDVIEAAFGASTAMVMAADAAATLRLDAAAGPTAHVDSLGRWVDTAHGLGVAVATVEHLVTEVPRAGAGLAVGEYDAMDSAAKALRHALATEDGTADGLTVVDDKIRGAKRDALTEHLLVTEPTRFANRNALFHFFLIDTEIQGCARTSCVVSAASTLQLFVQRIQMGLEGNAERVLDPDLIDDEEWEWRRQYRLWEANRKVFLYPENYLLPELRDDKTPLFATLETDLLSNDVTPQGVHDAYAQYMTGLEELGRLTIAGSLHQEEGDIFHFFGVSAEDPPVVYYRTAENIHQAGLLPKEFGVRWTAWQKIDVKIPVRKVTPVIVQGRLHLFWTTSNTRSVNDFVNGSSRFEGYQHELRLQYACMRLDGTWTPVQTISLDHPAFSDGVGTVSDELVRPTVRQTTSANNLLERFLGALRATGRVNERLMNAAFVRMLSRERDLANRFNRYWSDPPSDAELLDLANDVLDRMNLAISAGAQFGLYVARRDSRQPAHLHGNNDTKPQPFDGYRLRGYLWERPLIGSSTHPLRLNIANFAINEHRIDLFRRQLGHASSAGYRRTVRRAQKPRVLTLNGRSIQAVGETNFVPYGQSLSTETWGTVWSTRDRFRQLAHNHDHDNELDWEALYENHLVPWVSATLSSDADLEACMGTRYNALLELDTETLLITGTPWEGLSFDIRRVGSTLPPVLAERLFTHGIDGLLDTQFQVGLAEPDPGIRINTSGDPWFLSLLEDFDFAGPFGVYYRETFFHIPMALAGALHAAGDYSAALGWLKKVFDPSGAPVDDDTVAKDRVWRYRELRGLTIETLRAKLSNPAALEAYMADPYNPYAIARLRPTAFQHAVVMKYMDVLLDWADSLFSKFTTESINEAMMLYVMVSDLLGDKPEPVGDCLEQEPGTYDGLAQTIADNQAALAQAIPVAAPQRRKQRGAETSFVLSIPVELMWGSVGMHQVAMAMTSEPISDDTTAVSSPETDGVLATPRFNTKFNKDWAQHRTGAWSGVQPDRFAPSFDLPGQLRDRSNGQLVGMGRQVGVFCVPPNPKLLGYWDRVADRLFKIRHCLDIDGARRTVPLFAPPIDPLLLARMRAAGLSLDDVLNGSSGEVPPYRFAVLLQRAQAAAQSLQGAGAALISALQSRDNEQLSQLRNRHQTNLLRLSQNAIEQELGAATMAKQSAEARLETATIRRDHLQNLVSQGLSGHERTQQDLIGAGLILKSQAATWELVAGITHLIPELGAPTALKYGGKQLGDSFGFVASAFRSLAGMTDASGHAASVQGTFSRRRQSWQHELEMANRSISQAERDVEAAGMRELIALSRLDAHAESMVQADEIKEFFEDKLTNYGLYEWYATTLTRLFRDAYEAAIAVARLAERAFVFERPDDPTRLTLDYWDASHRGLLSGERLNADLMRLERRFVETDFRGLEIDQTFPLSQIDPDALWRLKATGECAFSIPERFFDLTYPGHYRRRIKAARITIPAVVGPYTNINATLELTASRYRLQANDADETPIPLQHASRIATSRAQNDGGLFDLSFGDPRYLPFEGAGAVSDWTLRLPRTFRAFDYNAIDDVLVHIAYTAQHDEALRERKMGETDDVSAAVVARLGTQPFVRVISFRHEMGATLRRLVDAPLGTEIPFTLRPEHLPYYLRGLPLTVRSAVIYVRGAASGVKISLNGSTLAEFSTTASPAAPAGARLEHAMAHTDAAPALGASWLGEHRLALTEVGAEPVEEILLGLELGL